MPAVERDIEAQVFVLLDTLREHLPMILLKHIGGRMEIPIIEALEGASNLAMIMDVDDERDMLVIELVDQSSTN